MPSPRRPAIPDLLRLPTTPAGRLTLAACVAALFALAALTWLALKGRGLDLAPLYIAGRLAWAGEQAHLYVYQPRLSPEVHDPAWIAAAGSGGYLDWLLAFVFPPIWAEIFAWPAAHADWRLFRAVFALANAGALVAGAVLAARLWAPKGEAAKVAALSLVALPFAWPAVASAFFNQVQPWAALAVLAALHEAERDRPARAGLLLALAASLKLSPAAMGVFWLMTGRWKAAAWSLAAGAGLFALNLAVAGVDPTRAFLDQLARIGGLLQAGGMNQSLLIPAATLFGTHLPGAIGTAPIPPGAQAVAWGGVLAALTLATIRLAPRGEAARRARLMPATLVLVTAASPLAWTHYFPFLVPMAFALALRSRFGWALGGGCVAALIAATLMFRRFPALHEAAPQITLAVGLALAAGAVLLPERRPAADPALRPPRAGL